MTKFVSFLFKSLQWNLGVIFLSLFMFLPSRLRSANEYTLQDLLKKAEKNAALVADSNALRRMAEAKVEQVEAGRWLTDFSGKAYGGIVPNVKTDITQNVVYNAPKADYSIAHLGGFFNGEIDATQPLFTFGKISGYQHMAERGKELAEQEVAKIQLEMRSLVKKAYYSLQLSEDSLLVLQDVDGKLKDASEKVEALLIKNAENVTEIDRLKIRVFAADVKYRSQDAGRGERLSRSALSELANLSGDWKLVQSNLKAEPVPQFTKEDIVSVALRRKPEINQLSEMLGLKQAEKQVNRADFFPTFFISGALIYATAPGRTEINNPYLSDPFNQFSAGGVIGLKQDLGFWRTRVKVNAVQAEIDRLRAQKDELVLKTKLESERAYEEALSAAEAIKINEDGFRAARGWLISAGLSFDSGTTETKDLLESFAAYFKAKADLTRSIYSLNIALADLSQVIGDEVLPQLRD